MPHYLVWTCLTFHNNHTEKTNTQARNKDSEKHLQECGHSQHRDATPRNSCDEAIILKKLMVLLGQLGNEDVPTVLDCLKASLLYGFSSRVVR